MVFMVEQWISQGFVASFQQILSYYGILRE